MPRPPAGSPAILRSDRWWCRCFAELVLVDELASAPAHPELRRRTPESEEQSMIVSTWQIFPKRSFVTVEHRARGKRRKTRQCAESMANQARHKKQSYRPNRI